MQARQVAAIAEARKKADAYRRQMQEMRAEDDKVRSKVNFEINTTHKIEQRRFNEALQSKIDAGKEALQKRRQTLADVLNTEFQVWSAECMDTAETMEERKAKLMKKAYALRDRREEERRDVVAKAYATIWKDGCDDLRELDCRAVDKFMGEEREKQIIEKRERKALEEINANAYYQEWSKRLDAIANADKAKQEVRAENNARTARGLEEQILQRQQAYTDKYNNMMHEAEIENAENNAAIENERQKDFTKKMDQIQRGRDILEFNKKYKDMADENASIEAKQDAILLNNALKLEQEQIAFENAKKAEGAQAAKKYRKYLEEMMIKEAEDTGFVDEMNKREFEKVQKARDDALQARQDARDYLMKLVHQGREEQIAYKKAQDLKEKEEGKIFANKFLSDMKEGIEKDKAEADARRQMNIDNNLKLQQQMKAREQSIEAAKQDVFLQDKRMQLIEKKHRERLANQGGVVRVHFPKRRPDTR